VRLPPAAWDDRADRLWAVLARDGSLWDRLVPEVTADGLDWLAPRLGKAGETVAGWAAALRERTPLGPEGLEGLAPLLGRRDLLGQAAAWGATPLSRSRQRALRLLLGRPALYDGERDWLSTALLTCEPLDFAPEWFAEDLALLLPVL